MAGIPVGWCFRVVQDEVILLPINLIVTSKKFLQLRDSNYHLKFRHFWQDFETPGSYLKKYRQNNGKNFEMVKMLCSRKSPDLKKL